MLWKRFLHKDKTDRTSKMSEPIKRFITGMQFEDNLAKRKYVRD